MGFCEICFPKAWKCRNNEFRTLKHWCFLIEASYTSFCVYHKNFYYIFLLWEGRLLREDLNSSLVSNLNLSLSMPHKNKLILLLNGQSFRAQMKLYSDLKIRFTGCVKIALWSRESESFISHMNFDCIVSKYFGMILNRTMLCLIDSIP